MRSWFVRVAAGLLACTLIAAVYLSADEDRAAPPAAKGADESAALAHKLHDLHMELFRTGRLRSIEDPYVWSLRCLNAEKAAKDDRASQFAATKAHMERMKAMAEFARAVPNGQPAGASPETSRLAAEYYLREAEQLLLTLNK